MAKLDVLIDSSRAAQGAQLFNDSLKQIRAGLVGVAGPFSRVSTVVGIFTAGLLAIPVAATVAAVAIGVKLTGAFARLNLAMIDTAIAADEVNNRFRVVFGDATPRAAASLDALAKAAGRSVLEFRNASAEFQDILVPMGLARDAAASLSLFLTRLSTDLASFTDKADEEVFARVASGIVGNSRAVLSLGIDLRETSLQNALFRREIIDTTRELDANEQVLGRLIVLHEDSQDAFNDSIETTNSFRNILRRLNATVKDTEGALGQELAESTRRAFLEIVGLDSAVAIIRVTLGTAAEAGKTFVSVLTEASIVARILINNSFLLRSILGGFGEDFERIREQARFERVQGTLIALGQSIAQVSGTVATLTTRFQRQGLTADEAFTKTIDTLEELIPLQQEAFSGAREAEFVRLLAEVQGAQETLVTATDNYAAALRSANREAELFARTHSILLVGAESAFNGIANAAGSVAGGFQTLGDAARQVFQNLIADIVSATTRLVLFRTLIAPIFSGFGLSTLATGQLFGVPVPAQHGALINRPTIIPGSGPGVRPTIAGEAGPEFIVPATRNARTGGLEPNFGGAGGGSFTFNTTIVMRGGGESRQALRRSLNQHRRDLQRFQQGR